MDKNQAKLAVQKLVDKYEEVLRSGTKNKYTEEETKKGFIVPLFTALGWNMEEKTDVSAEEHISGDRVDYGFYINSRPKFYLEAKPLKTDLNDVKYARQAIKYSWNKGVTWAVLSDFESVKVFNADFQSEELAHSKFFDISYDKYGEDFDRLWLLSKESFESGDIDKKAEEWGKALKRVSVTDALYKDLTESRKLLTDSLKRWNEKVSDDLLDEGVQKLLNRLVFIRVLEDRNIEPQILKTIVREWESGHYEKERPPLYLSLVKKFRELDAQYNSNLFDEHPFEKWEEHDNYTKKVIDILYGKSGYYEYDFKIMPADILGAVYENYLGYKLEQLKKGSKAGQDSKKRKEHGIYYTPEFIVDYIIKNALKPVLEQCGTIDDLMKIKVLDPACGSGSFLIKAVDAIYQRYYEMSFRGSSTYKKIQIITQNIYGVDLDSQAVEIARLNLLINAVEEKILLPSLAKNVKNGNSLVSGTDEEMEKYFGPSWRDKKPFNWDQEFPEVFKQGGFDVVVGNPPYVNVANIKDSAERDYLKENFETAKNKSDLYSFFTEKAIKLLKDKGFLGFIISNSWLGTDSFSKFREFLVKKTSVKELAKLSMGVFNDATVTPVLIFLEKEKSKPNHIIKLTEYSQNKFRQLPSSLSYDRIENSPSFNFSFNQNISFTIPTIKLVKIAKFSLGIKTSDDKRFILDEKKDQDSYRLLRGKDVYRYGYKWANKWIWYKPDLMMEKIGAGPRKIEYFLTPKLLFRSITGGSMMVAFDENNFLTNDKVHILYQVEGLGLKFTLGILNSRLINFWIKSTFGDLLEIKPNQLEQIPIPQLDLKNNQTKEKHDNLLRLVDKIISLNKNLAEVSENSNEWQKIKDEIEKTDKLIDQKVYELYGLTEEEIKIVEN